MYACVDACITVPNPSQTSQLTLVVLVHKAHTDEDIHVLTNEFSKLSPSPQPLHAAESLHSAEQDSGRTEMSMARDSNALAIKSAHTSHAARQEKAQARSQVAASLLLEYSKALQYILQKDHPSILILVPVSQPIVTHTY